MRPTPYVASLRIYEPLEAFSAIEQLRWSEISMVQHTGHQEQSLALTHVIKPAPPISRIDGAHVIEHEGQRYVAPWSTALRIWAALSVFKDSLPATVIPYFLPDAIEEVLTTGIEEADIGFDKAPHILTETWVIPPRWFTLFLPEERLRGDSPDGPYTIVRTTLINARKRAQIAYAAVVNAFGDGDVAEEMKVLVDWLDIFHPSSIVELDYGGLAGYLTLTEGDINADSSLEDIQQSLAGLISGDGQEAGIGYSRLVSRWRRVAMYEQAT
jgi:hypothetical protein